MSKLFVIIIAGAVLSAAVTAAIFLVPLLLSAEDTAAETAAEKPPAARIFIGPITIPVIEDKEGRRGTEFIEFVTTVDGDAVAHFCSIEPIFLDTALSHISKRIPRRKQRGSVDLKKLTHGLRRALIPSISKYFDAESLGEIEAHTRSTVLSKKKHLKLLKVNFVCKAGEAEKI